MMYVRTAVVLTAARITVVAMARAVRVTLLTMVRVILVWRMVLVMALVTAAVAEYHGRDGDSCAVDVNSNDRSHGSDSGSGNAVGARNDEGKWQLRR